MSKVRFAARCPLQTVNSKPPSEGTDAGEFGRRKAPSTIGLRTTEQIVAIGSSIGGTEAIREILRSMPVDSPGVVIAQHIPLLFSASCAARMDQISPMTVCEVADGQQMVPGHAYIAPGDSHLRVVRSGHATYVTWARTNRSISTTHLSTRCSYQPQTTSASILPASS